MNSSDKLLTVIVPSYNMEEYLPKCLGSLIVPDEAMLQRLDVIVVNDGSKDRTSEIAHDFEKRYPGVFRVIDKKNGNYGSCINVALPEVKGFYVRILDADDSVDSHGFLKLIAVLIDESANQEKASDLVISDYETVNLSGTVMERHCYRLPKYQHSSMADIDLSDNRFGVQTIIYRRRVFQMFDYHQTEGISYSDNEWDIEPMIGVQKLFYLPVPVTKYLFGRNGQTMDPSIRIARYSHIVQLAKNLASRFQLLDAKCKPEARSYYRYRLLQFITSIYYSKIFAKKRDLEGFDLGVFDLWLQSYPELYRMVGAFSFPTKWFTLPYINFWRKGGWTWFIISRLLKGWIVCKTTVRTKFMRNNDN